MTKKVNNHFNIKKDWKWISAFALVAGVSVLNACAPGSNLNHKKLQSSSEYEENDNSSDLETEDRGTGIIHGKKIVKNSSSSVVALVSEREQGQALCTGTLISPNVVLTAAHCVEQTDQRIYVVFNSDLSRLQNSDLREADRVIQHPRWLRPSMIGEGDLALIHFKGEAPSTYRPAQLAPRDFQLNDKMKIKMVGFGVSDGHSHEGAGQLRETSTVLIGKKSPTEFITDGEKHSVCFGDSGGPAFIMIGKNKYQVGVASSVLNAECNQASIHTEVMSYLDWIQKYISKWSQPSGK